MNPLSSPLTLPCGRVLPNRLAKSAMSERLAAGDRVPNRAHETLYGRWAAGGLGLCITGNVMVDPKRLGEPGNVAIPEERAPNEAWKAWAAAAEQEGTVAIVQLNHPGRQSPRTLDPEPVAPSVVPMRGTYGAFATPRALEVDEINGLVARFAHAAAFVEAAGFSGAQVHAAHGYLVSQFLSPHTNHRTDAYGGDLAGRTRFLLEIVAAMRAAVRPGFLLSVKLNTADFQKGGWNEAEAVEVAVLLEAAGVDLLELSGGTYEKAAMFAEKAKKASTRRREAFFVEAAEQVRARTRIPLMLTGGLRTRAAMVALLEADQIDVVGLARPLAVEPDLPRRLLTGTADGAVPIAIHTGVASFDAMLTGAWYQVQIDRLARGEEANPDLGRLPAVSWYLRDMWRGRRRAA